MTSQPDSGFDYEKKERLPRCDWFLLPLISVITICAILAVTEFTARRLFSESNTSTRSCLVLTDPATGIRGIPNSVCWEKVPEDQLVEYRFDNCGYRSGMQCGRKSPGTYRIVMMGSSFAIGERVPIDKTFATLLPQQLAERTGRKIELYNEGMAYGFPHSAALRFNDVLSQQPDLILWVLTPADIGEGEIVYAEGGANTTVGPSRLWSKLKEAITSNSIMDRVRVHVEHTATGVMLQHFIYKNESQSQYVNSYLEGPDRVNGFLRAEMSPLWKDHVKEFDRRAAEIEGRASAAGAAFVAVFLPNRAQAAMISMSKWPAGYDPYELNNELAGIIARHGGTSIDVLPGFRSIPNPEQYYLPVDGHPTAGAHIIFSRLLADGLTTGAVRALNAPAHNQVAIAKGK